MTDRIHSPGLLAAPGLPGAARSGAASRLVARLAAHWAHWRAARRRSKARRELAQLDPRTLRDLGLAPCEIDSVLAELDGAALVSRARVLMSLHRTGPWP